MSNDHAVIHQIRPTVSATRTVIGRPAAAANGPAQLGGGVQGTLHRALRSGVLRRHQADLAGEAHTVVVRRGRAVLAVGDLDEVDAAQFDPSPGRLDALERPAGEVAVHAPFDRGLLLAGDDAGDRRLAGRAPRRTDRERGRRSRCVPSGCRAGRCRRLRPRSSGWPSRSCHGGRWPRSSCGCAARPALRREILRRAGLACDALATAVALLAAGGFLAARAPLLLACAIVNEPNIDVGRSAQYGGEPGGQVVAAAPSGPVLSRSSRSSSC